MNIVMVNGSPRRDGSTAKLLCAAVDGAKSVAGENVNVERIDVYSKPYMGCKSCLACKLPAMQGKGCVVTDEMTADIKKAEAADVLLMGTPVYFFSESSGFKAFYERLLYPYKSYLPQVKTLFPRQIQAGIIYTMNMAQESFENASPYLEKPSICQPTVKLAAELVGTCEAMVVHGTLRTPNFERYVIDVETERVKAEKVLQTFPAQLQAAYELGAKLARQAMAAAV